MEITAGMKSVFLPEGENRRTDWFRKSCRENRNGWAQKCDGEDEQSEAFQKCAHYRHRRDGIPLTYEYGARRNTSRRNSTAGSLLGPAAKKRTCWTPGAWLGFGGCRFRMHADVSPAKSAVLLMRRGRRRDLLR